MTPVRLEPAALGSRVKHSTTGPLGPQTLSLDYISGTFIEDGNQAIFLLEYHCLHVSYFSIMYKLLFKIYKEECKNQEIINQYHKKQVRITSECHNHEPPDQPTAP